MKSILTAIALSVSVSIAFADDKAQAPQPKYKEVCKEVKKNGKDEKVCKKIRVHKKLDGKPVPQK